MKQKILTIGTLLYTLLAFNLEAIPEETPGKKELIIIRPQNNTATEHNHIAFLGSAQKNKKITINETTARRSTSGHFASLLPLPKKNNLFKVKCGNAEDKIKVTRISNEPEPLVKLSFAKNSLTPYLNIEVMPDEYIYFSALAPPRISASVSLGEHTIPLKEKINISSANTKLDNKNDSKKFAKITFPVTPVLYEGYLYAEKPLPPLKPVFKIELQKQAVTKQGPGTITILNPEALQGAEIIVKEAIVRTGPSNDYPRLTPLNKGKKDYVSGRYGEWLRLKFGGWVKEKDIKIIKDYVSEKAIIQDITTTALNDRTEIKISLNYPVPYKVEQGEKTFTLSLFNTIHQSDSIQIKKSTCLNRIEWLPKISEHTRYTFFLNSPYQWGYHLNYKDSVLTITLRHAPDLSNIFSVTNPLKRISILIDAGHGGRDPGTIGPTGYPEKTATLSVSKLLKKELEEKGATVYMTREDDSFVDLQKRVDIIADKKPSLSLSIHFNSNPTNIDPFAGKGVSTHWYHYQSHSLALFLHDYIVTKMKRRSHGIIWQTLKLTRPHHAPALLLELGFLSHPEEFDEICNPEFQKQMAATISEGIIQWFRKISKEINEKTIIN